MASYFFMDGYGGKWQSGVTDCRLNAPIGSGLNLKIINLMNYSELNRFALSKIYERGSSSAKAIVKNQRSALKRWMTHFNLSPESTVSSELLDTATFEAQLASLSFHLAISDAAKTDLRYRLRNWHRAALELKLKVDCPSVSKDEAELMSKAMTSRRRMDIKLEKVPIGQRLLYLLMQSKGLTAYAVAKQIKVSANSVRAWMYAESPPSRLGDIEALEKLLGVEDDSLRTSLRVHPSLLRNGYRFVATGPAGTLGGPPLPGQADYVQSRPAPVVLRSGRTVTEHSARCERNRSKRTRYLPMDAFTQDFIKEWWVYFAYKSAPSVHPLKRTGRGRWSPRPADQVPGQRLLDWISKDGLAYPTAEQQLGLLRGYFGFLCTPPKEDGSGGYGIPIDEAQTFAWLADADALIAYFNHRTAISEGLKHGGQKAIMMLASGLCRDKKGFLPQHLKLVPTSFKRRFGLLGKAAKMKWHDMCERAFETAISLGKDCQDISRDPAEPIKDFIHKDGLNSLVHLFSAADRLERIGDYYTEHGDKRQAAHHYRGALLFNVLCLVPLRRANLQALTYFQDNTGQIRMEADGTWTIRIPQTAFKNRRYAKQRADYAVHLPPSVSLLVTKYLMHSRPYFLNCRGRQRQSRYLFVSELRPYWDAMSPYVKKKTAEFFPNTPGFSMHAFRHVVATFFLKLHPDQYAKVANLLNDTLRTVLENYAHNTVEESIQAHVEGVLSEAKATGVSLNLQNTLEAQQIAPTALAGIPRAAGVLPPVIDSEPGKGKRLSLAMPKLQSQTSKSRKCDATDVEDLGPRGGALGAVGPSVGSAETLVA